MKVEFDIDEISIEPIILADLKQALKYVKADPSEKNADNLKQALETVIKYYGG